MAGILIVVLLILYFFGYIHIPWLAIPNPLLFTFGGHDITLLTILIFLAILWAIGILPSPIRQIAMIVLLLWILSTVGIIAVTGLSNLLVIAILVGLIISVLQ